MMGCLSRRLLNTLLSIGVIGIMLIQTSSAQAQETDQEVPVGAVGGSVRADMFTGTATTSIPIEVPPGRQGVQPELALVYGSANGNGWIGMGWKLEKGVIERQTKFGVDYSGDDYVFRLSGINVELVNIGNDEYRSKIEGGFTRVEKLTASDGKPYFLATDKTGKKFYFGQAANTRVADPSNANNIFRWCLDRVEDPNGNYMTITYTLDQGQGYLDTISYTGNGSLAPTNTVKFYLEDRPDAPPMYVPNFEMTTAKRLKTIEVKANGNLVRAYALTYTTSASTSRSLLNNVQQYGKDTTINSAGTIVGGTSLPPVTSVSGNGTNGFESDQFVLTGHLLQSSDGSKQTYVGDFNGDGKADVLRGGSTSTANALWYTTPFATDNLTSLSNGLGATTTIEYTPSTEYTNTQLPYPVQTVSKFTTDDGNGNVAETTYEYLSGFHHIAERDFRGFNYAKVTGQAGPSGERTITKTWFHQGNDIAVHINDPNVPDGYLKGAPYLTKVTDGGGNLYTETTTTYTADDNGQAPFFSPPASVVTDICDGNGCSKTTRTDFTYDVYGNITREDQYGDTGTSSDDRTVVRTFNPNTTEWILGLPASETIYQGLGTGNQVARTDFYYDGTTSCGAPSSNQQPTQGNLTRVVRWLNGGTSPETRMAYDALGNVICTRDANGNTTTMAYDASGTFATTVTNPLGHVTTTQYYGVDGVAMDAGLYGQVKTVTDPNGAMVSTAYDALGRRTSVTQPDGFWTTTSYNSFGTVGTQHIRTDSSLGLSTWTYFDGLGRSITAKSTGTDSKIIVTQTQYDARGAVTRTSLPYFENGGTAQWVTNTYDPMGRVIHSTNPDGNRGLTCHDDWVSVSIDANDHKKRTVRDAYGRVVTVQEYTGTHTTCTTSAGSPYATTTYNYDVLGNLLTLSDAQGNVSTMAYDTLSRKTSMHDPDMGTWTYVYDANGNLTLQTDAKNQQIHFHYDILNRRVQKDYGTQKTLGSGDVVYTYDGSTNNRKGRLQKVDDSSGTTTFFYDVTGRVTKTDKVVDSTTYTTQSTYDGLGRVTAVTYPDNSTVTQTFNGPQLHQVKEGSLIYASYSGFNALGQPSTLTLGNGVATTYTYDAQNFRLKTLKSVKGSTTLQDLGYAFDAGGNVTALTDVTHGDQSFSYDDVDRLTSATGSYGTISYTYNEIGNMLSNSQVATYSYPASGGSSVRPHAVSSDGTNTYTYDANGNMTLGAGRIITYDYENRPDSVIKGGVTTTFVYDGDGGRVKKTEGTEVTTYIGKLYVCEGSVPPLSCAKMIFAGGQRIAMVQVDTGAISYFHSDHLGSTSVLTDAAGTSEQDVAYYPYGDTRTNTGTADVAYKYTGKEQDDSTGLYFYEARYYDPVLGRFISPDTIVPSPTDPQALDRYSYARNNPILYQDPTGHCFGLCILAGAIIGAVSAGIQSDWDLKATLLGAAIGGVAGGVVGGNIAPFVSGAVGGPYGGIIGGAVGGAIGGTAAGATSAALYRAAGYDVNIGTAAWQGAAAGAIFGAVNGHFGKTWTPQRVAVTALAGGVSSQATGDQFLDGFVSSLVVAGVTYTALQMREFVGEIADKDTRNTGAKSVGFNGDNIKRAGGFWVPGVDEQPFNPLGCQQSGPGCIGPFSYSAGSLADYSLEAFAGPHDFANFLAGWYDAQAGHAKNWQGWLKVYGETMNVLNVLAVTPIVAGSVVGISPLPSNSFDPDISR